MGEDQLALPWISSTLSRRQFLSLPSVCALLLIVPDVYRFSLVERSLNGSSALFLYSGWAWIEHGRVPYLHTWDVKPPVVHELAAVIALLTGGDRVLMYYVGIAIMIVAFVGSVGLATWIVYDLTVDSFVAVLSGFLVLSFPPVYTTVVTGLDPRTLGIFVGLVSILLFIRNRITASVVASVIAVMTYQTGIGFFLAVLVSSLRIPKESDAIDHSRIREVVGPALVAGIAILAPLIVAGAIFQMLEQTIVAPLVGPKPHDLPLGPNMPVGLSDIPINKPEDTVSLLGSTWPLAILGTGSGFVISRYRDHFDPRAQVVAVPVLVLGLNLIISIDLEDRADFLMLMVMSAVGAALWIDALPDPEVSLTEALEQGLSGIDIWMLFSAGHVLRGMLIVMLLLNLPLFAGNYITEEKYETTNLYWSGEVSSKCHIQMGIDERHWLRTTPADGDAEVCGSGLSFSQLLRVLAGGSVELLTTSLELWDPTRIGINR